MTPTLSTPSTPSTPSSSGGRRAAVLGHPIAHSLSPALHRAAYAALGLRGWTYQAIDVDEAGLPGFLAGLDDSWAGLSLTMPLKRAVRPLLAAESELAGQVGGVNTVTFGPDGLVGDNTDVPGIVAALSEVGVHTAGQAAVLGGGATAASALAALRELGCRAARVHVRSVARSRDLLAAAERLAVEPGLRALDPVAVAADGPLDVLVSTLPAGAADDAAERFADAALAARTGAGLAGLPVLLDVVYAPWPTRLARAWTVRGGTVVGGLAMLLHQAGDQVRLMTGLAAPLADMLAGARAELRQRARPTPPLTPS